MKFYRKYRRRREEEETLTAAKCGASQPNRKRKAASNIDFKQEEVAAESESDSSDEEDQTCLKCLSGGDASRLLLCDGCDSGCFHTYCLDPPLSSIPKGDWHCPSCAGETDSEKCVVCLSDGQPSRLLLCDSCDSGFYHTFCLDPPLSSVPKGEWNCPQCLGHDSDQICVNCRSGTDPSKLLLCDSCDGCYHIYCLFPPLRCIPQGDWHCPTCTEDRQRLSPNEELTCVVCRLKENRDSMVSCFSCTPGTFHRSCLDLPPPSPLPAEWCCERCSSMDVDTPDVVPASCCVICLSDIDEGSLVCCSTCESGRFHAACLGIGSITADHWRCSFCLAFRSEACSDACEPETSHEDRVSCLGCGELPPVSCHDPFGVWVCADCEASVLTLFELSNE